MVEVPQEGENQAKFLTSRDSLVEILRLTIARLQRADNSRAMVDPISDALNALGDLKPATIRFSNGSDSESLPRLVSLHEKKVREAVSQSVPLIEAEEPQVNEQGSHYIEFSGDVFPE